MSRVQIRAIVSGFWPGNASIFGSLDRAGGKIVQASPYRRSPQPSASRSGRLPADRKQLLEEPPGAADPLPNRALAVALKDALIQRSGTAYQPGRSAEADTVTRDDARDRDRCRIRYDKGFSPRARIAQRGLYGRVEVLDRQHGSLRSSTLRTAAELAGAKGGGRPRSFPSRLRRKSRPAAKSRMKCPPREWPVRRRIWTVHTHCWASENRPR